MQWLSQSPWLAWLGVALLCAAIEAATVDFVFVMLAGGALGGALTAALGGGLPAQVIVAAVLSVVLLAAVRPLVRAHFLDHELAPGIGAAGLVGRHARVLETVTDTGGRIKLAGEVWSARTSVEVSCAAGSDVRVVELAGATAIVVPVESADLA